VVIEECVGEEVAMKTPKSYSDLKLVVSPLDHAESRPVGLAVEQRSHRLGDVSLREHP